MNRQVLKILLVLFLGIIACSVLSDKTSSLPTITPDNIATQVAEAKAIAATLTAEVPAATTTSKPQPTATPNQIATQVAQAKAIALTLTAEIPKATATTQAPPTEVSEPSSTLESIPLSENLYFSKGNNLYKMGLDGSSPENIAQGLWRSERLAMDTKDQKLFISYWDQSAQIMVFDLVSGTINVFRDGPTGGGQGLAIDALEGKMYLGLYYDVVYVTGFNTGSPWIQLVSPGSLSPLLGQRGQLQIDSANQHIYFRSAFNGDCGLCRYIWRVNLDGTNLSKIIPANGGDALALDLTEKTMYFSDAPGDFTIKRANFDGSNVETILTLPDPYRFCRTIALDVKQKKIYMSLYYNLELNHPGRAIARSNMDGSEFEILYQITGDSDQEISGDMALYLP